MIGNPALRVFVVLRCLFYGLTHYLAADRSEARILITLEFAAGLGSLAVPRMPSSLDATSSTMKIIHIGVGPARAPASIVRFLTGPLVGGHSSALADADDEASRVSARRHVHIAALLVILCN